MIVTTTNQIDGREIAQYIRIVAGETIVGINALKDFTAGLRNIVGGRSAAYEGEAQAARESALAEMVDRAIQLGADAVIGVSLDYSALGQANNMLMVSATGTAVKLA